MAGHSGHSYAPLEWSAQVGHSPKRRIGHSPWWPLQRLSILWWLVTPLCPFHHPLQVLGQQASTRAKICAHSKLNRLIPYSQFRESPISVVACLKNTWFHSFYANWTYSAKFLPWEVGWVGYFSESSRTSHIWSSPHIFHFTHIWAGDLSVTGMRQ